MPLLELDRIIKEYYEANPELYSYIPFDKFVKICKAPFWFFNKSMARDDLPTVHIKYLGQLIVLPSRIKHLLKDNDTQLKFNSINIEEHERRKQNLNRILNEIHIDDEQTMEFTSEDTEES